MLYIEILKVLKRKFDFFIGKEIDFNYGKDKKVSIGYLMFFYSKFFFIFSRIFLFIVVIKLEVCIVVCFFI